MTRRLAGFLGGGVALAGALAAQPAHADTDSLRYEAAEGCPTRTEFVAAVAARGATFAQHGSDAEPHFDVRIEAHTDGFQALLSVRSGALTSNPREVRAPSCAEVVDALAVVTAIALNPAREVPAAAASTSAVAPAAAETPRAPLRGASDVWNKTVQVGPGELHLDSAITIDAYLGASIGLVSTRASPRLDIAFSRANFVTAPEGQSYLIGTIARLRASLIFDRTYQLGDFKTQVGGQEFGAGLCFSPHYDTAGWVLLGCAEISAGLVGMRTKDANGAITQNKTQGFGSLGLGLESSYHLARHLQVGVRVGAEALTSRVAGERPDGSQLFASSSLIASGMLAIGTQF